MLGSTPAIHPGEILRMEFLVPLNLSAYTVAKQCKVPRTRIERLAREEVPVTADTALRLGPHFRTRPRIRPRPGILGELADQVRPQPSRERRAGYCPDRTTCRLALLSASPAGCGR